MSPARSRLCDRALRVALVFLGVMLEVSSRDRDGFGITIALIQIAAVWVAMNRIHYKS